jgi:hypothetical protein
VGLQEKLEVRQKIKDIIEYKIGPAFPPEIEVSNFIDVESSVECIDRSFNQTYEYRAFLRAVYSTELKSDDKDGSKRAKLDAAKGLVDLIYGDIRLELQELASELYGSGKMNAAKKLSRIIDEYMRYEP